MTAVTAPAPEHLTTLPVSEIFGPVFQGEGPHAGRVCWFLRLGLCNLRCSWCDSAYTWDTSRYDVHAECPPMTANEIRSRLPRDGVVVLSGGEPLIHQHSTVLHEAIPDEVELHVETNGTLVPGRWALDRVSHFTVSPKLATQGDPYSRRVRPGTLAAFAHLADTGRAIFKVVVRDVTEVEMVARWMDQYGVPPAARWVMPEGVVGTEVLHRARAIADTVARLGMNLSLRQHVLLYGMERGR